MAKAFLSHSSSDKLLVKKIAKQLGDGCVLDEISFEAGRKTLDEIFSHLSKTDIFVLFISNESLKSPWVQKEINKAKENISSDIIDRVFAIIIDKSITYRDERIPQWLSDPYNLKYIENENIILKKIRQHLFEINFKRSKYNAEIEKLFIGRNEQIQKFENDINNLDNWIPTYIIAYYYFEGIGRRTFLKNVLRKSNFMSYIKEPFIITIDSKESIENFIYKLNSISEIDEIIKYDFSIKSIDEKIKIARDLVIQFIDNQEIIFIVDEGGIVLPNGYIVDWFKQIVSDNCFNNRLSFCLISKYHPEERRLKNERKSLVYRIQELSNSETKNLFIKLLTIYGLGGIDVDDKQFFIDRLTGSPSQVIFAVNQIGIDLLSAKKHINDIIEFSDNFSNIILTHIKENDPLAYQMVILLSQEEIVSREIIVKVFGDNETTESAMQILYDLSIFNFVLSDYEYLKLNTAISDYVSRSRLELDASYKEKLRMVSKALLTEDLDDVLRYDYSSFIMTIQGMIEQHQKVPSKYFIPSLIIKNIIKKYDKGEYHYVIKICLQLLENSRNYDEQIIWETEYRLTLAYARTKDERFFDHIGYFNNTTSKLDYYFLLGFYHRHKNEKDLALEYYNKVLDINSNHSRAKREKVIILLSKGEYQEALDLARGNYEKRRTNIYHIHSYFVCIIRRRIMMSEKEISILNELIAAAEKSSDIKAEDIARCMKGEYEYYINNNMPKASSILKEAIKLNNNKVYPRKSLLEIYKRRGMDNEYDLLKQSANGDDEEFYE
jgi:hypothetical protein